MDCSKDFTFGAGPRVQHISGSVVDQGGYSYQLTLDGIDSVMKFESITQAYSATCGTYSYSIELADSSQAAYFNLTGDEITIYTSSITSEFIASMTVKFKTTYHEDVFIDPLIFSVISCESYQ